MVAEPIIRSGVDRRFDALYRAHHQEILAYFIRRIPRPDAEDAAAEVFTIAWRRLSEVPQGEQVLAWLYGVAHKVLSNHWRTRGRIRRLTGRLGGLAANSPKTPEILVLRSAEDQMLLDALEQLRPSDRELLKLATWERLPHGTIGELFGISEAAASKRISRARQRLARELERMERRQRFRIPLLRRKEG